MIRRLSIFSDWSRDQIVLILAPALASLLLVALYFGGMLAMPWPALLMLVLLINLAGDVVYAIRSERRVREGRTRLCNDPVGQRVVAEADFACGGSTCRGTVLLAGERWRAVCGRRVAGGETLAVTGRRGLTLVVL